jgi:hypothetical protein
MKSKETMGAGPLIAKDDPAAEHAAFAESLQVLLRKNEDDLDYVTASKLSAARARAVAQAGHSRLRWPWATAIPTACALALAVWLGLPGIHGAARHSPASAVAPVDVLEALGSDGAPVTEDELDFAQWLDQQPADAPAAAPSTSSI